MIPSTTHTNLHHITGVLTLLAVKCRQFRRLGNAATERRKTPAKHIGNVDKFVFLANRTINFGKFTDVLGGANQFGMGVANIDATKPPALQFSEEVSAGQLVIDRGRPSPVGSTNCFGAKRHCAIRYRPATSATDCFSGLSLVSCARRGANGVHDWPAWECSVQ